MKFIEVQGGWLQPISNEENIVLEKIKGVDDPFPKSSLSEREKELARRLVTRGLLTRIIIEDKLHFVACDLEDIWEL
jgi:hypothetical protein